MKSHRSTLLQPSTLMRGHLTSSESFSKRVRNVRNSQGHDLSQMSNVRIGMIKGWDGGLASPRRGFRGEGEASTPRLERFKVRTVQVGQVVKEEESK
ncbi:hypothetical protein SLEP1_g45562 [Rubroshorea leprosula]|uniref:Uncharacterized protein n=1 Tax=Rubroshorea leprosula TaxID=152421 RepID=A0AAV5LJR5_9ROSI|nr:hypothetical protein SLEP1_g45562 [Rubroshorea leprosula]